MLQAPAYGDGWRIDEALACLMKMRFRCERDANEMRAGESIEMKMRTRCDLENLSRYDLENRTRTRCNLENVVTWTRYVEIWFDAIEMQDAI